jgi:hypothetical protein
MVVRMAGYTHVDREDLVVWGRTLRFLLVDEIRNRGTMTVAEMVAFLADAGFELPGRASKVVSDALRWEIARGRVNRLRRGVYRYGRVPKSTARRIRLFARKSHAWIEAVLRGQDPPPTPPDPTRPHLDMRFAGVSRRPWECLNWLWIT